MVDIISCDGGLGKFFDLNSNQQVEYWPPFGIGLVREGNHSIMTGMSQCGQQLETKEVYDLSALFPLVHCDGWTDGRVFH
jgi:hypothetical protein